MKDRHSFSEALVHSKPAIVLIARSTPPHFSTISFPKLIKAWFSGSCPYSNATFTNKLQAFSLGRPFRACHEVAPIILATCTERVVTITLLPLAPTINKFLKRSHSILSSFHKSSKTIKFFLKLTLQDLKAFSMLRLCDQLFYNFFNNPLYIKDIRDTNPKFYLKFCLNIFIIVYQLS